MDYTPVTAVWEITMGCNMRCGHCGSSCADPLPDELTTEEALRVCDDMKKLGMRWITLSGGEPLIRKDWPLLAGRLYQNGIIPNIITNGWLVNEQMVRTAEANGVETISISLDGTRESHDRLRKPGSYDKVINAFRVLKKCNHISGANTTITKQNLPQLDRIREILIENGVALWQLQIGLPMGNLAAHREDVIEPAAVEYLLDYACRTNLEGKIKIFPADCLGYFTEREGIARQIGTGSPVPVVWQGCNAGKRSFGLLHNGDVLGCTSIRDQSLVEGNVRTRSLVEIWNDPDSFSWARGMKKEDLAGDCRECGYGEVCLGGCPNTRLTLGGSIHSANEYCSYHLAMEETRKTLAKYADVKELLEVARQYVSERKEQLASLTLQRALEIEPGNRDILAWSGFVHFTLGNFPAAREANRQILAADPGNVYALKGLGLSLHKLRQTKEAVRHLNRAVRLSPPDQMDAWYDLALVYHESGQPRKALQTLEQGERKSPGFLLRAAPLYEQLRRQSPRSTTGPAGLDSAP